MSTTYPPTEEPTLGEVCRVLDSIEAVEAGLRQHGYIGADGKPSPLLAEARQQRATLVRLLGLLDLPLAEDEDQAKARVAGRSRSARRAARARWTTH